MNTKSDSRILFIGMPVYNGEKLVARAIQSIIDQSYSNWQLVISDNNSTDQTPEICRNFAAKYKNIKFIKQPKNLGPAENFLYLLRLAETPLFVWAAHDDFWHKNFLKSCIQELTRNTTTGMAFSNILEIDDNNQQKRIHCLDRFAGKPTPTKIVKYILEDEYLGKANPIYSVYKTQIIKQAAKMAPLKNNWGSDMLITCAAMSLTEVAIIPEFLFNKHNSAHFKPRNSICKVIHKTSLVISIFQYVSKYPQILADTAYFIPACFASYLKILLFPLQRCLRKFMELSKSLFE